MLDYLAKFGPFAASVLAIVLFRRCPGFIRGTLVHFVLTTVALTLLVYGSVYELKRTPGFTLWNAQLSPVEFDQPGSGASPLYLPRGSTTYWFDIATAIICYVTLPAAAFRSAGVYGRERFGARLGQIANLASFLLSILFSTVGEVLASFLIVVESLFAPYSPFNVPLMLGGAALLTAVLLTERRLRRRRQQRPLVAPA